MWPSHEVRRRFHQPALVTAADRGFVFSATALDAEDSRLRAQVIRFDLVGGSFLVILGAAGLVPSESLRSILFLTTITLKNNRFRIGYPQILKKTLSGHFL